MRKTERSQKNPKSNKAVKKKEAKKNPNEVGSETEYPSIHFDFNILYLVFQILSYYILIHQKRPAILYHVKSNYSTSKTRSHLFWQS